MANPQVIWQLSKGFLSRNNPVETLLKTAFEAVHNLATFRSKMKLLKYKFMLAHQQLERMENHVHNNEHEVRGNQFDRPF